MLNLRPALVTFGALALVTGLAYPLAMTGLGQALFPRQANGSLLVRNGEVLGSALVGQHTEDPKYFWGRLSATADHPTNAMASGGSNLAPGNPGLKQAAEARIRALRAVDPAENGPVPADLATASASGLDPDISPAAADFQVRRVAKARGLPEPEIRELVRRHTEGRTLGFLGEPRVHVLPLNLALDGRLP